MIRPKLLTVFFVCIFLLSCSNNKHPEAKAQPTSPIEKTSDWEYLFDGKDASGWRSFNGKDLPEGWVVENGTLKSLGQGGDIGGDIVYGKKAFTNFELYLEWKISKGGNSGIFYHVREGEKYKAAYENAPEYQVIDDIDFGQPLEDWQSVGADYAMYAADRNKKKVRPHGAWNTSRIIFTPQKAEYWLNGEKVVSFIPWSEDWNKRKNEGKWKDYPDYGVAKTGLIGLQDHGSFIWYRNIKIREL